MSWSGVLATVALVLVATAAAIPVEVAAAPQGQGASPRSSGGHYRPPSSAVRPGGHYSGNRHAGHRHGGPAHSGYRHSGHRYGYGYGGYRPAWGVYWSAPFLFGSHYYGYPSAYWGPRQAYSSPAYSAPYEPPGAMLPPERSAGPTTQVDPGREGAPTQQPLYLNYCESAKAYYPKVTSCPEGWQIRRPDYN